MANRKRNVNFIKPEDPAFLKALKKEAGYDDRNHKFDDLQNEEGDFVDDEDSEQPQVVVLKSGDLTAEEANVEKERLEKEELEKKADLTQKVLFKPKRQSERNTDRKRKEPTQPTVDKKKSKPILSFDDNEEEDEED